MLEPTNRVMSDYHIIVVKMVPNFVNKNCTKVNFELLYDIEVLFELAILLPLLKEVNNNLMKLVKAWEIFVVNYVVAIKLCYTYLFSNFVNIFTLLSSLNCFIFSSIWWIPPMTSSLVVDIGPKYKY
jgi:hypothetical protein